MGADDSSQDASLKGRARRLRKEQTQVEKLLWDRLQSRRLGSYKFLRQHVKGPYILDSYCFEARLAIELDGAHHIEPEQAGYDVVRTRYLDDLGIEVMRFPNARVEQDIRNVLLEIYQKLRSRAPNPHKDSN